MKKVIIFELNRFHGECLPFFVKYFLDNNYQVDALLNAEMQAEAPLYMFDGVPNLNIKYDSMTNILEFLRNGGLDGYDTVYFNSDCIMHQGKWRSVFYFAGKLPRSIHIVSLQHRYDTINTKLKKNTSVVVLKKFADDNSIFEINSHYFGKHAPHNKKSKTVNFIVVGAIEKKRKNFDALVNAVTALHESGVHNFKITVIGRGNLDDIPENIRKYFNILGRMSYPDMYSQMQSADFFLTLLSPQNPEHDRYITTGTSGSFQLIYGFNIPALIARKFATIHGFDDKNSLLYDNDSDLATAMTSAINMSDKDYASTKAALADTIKDIEQHSLQEMRRALSKTYSPVPFKLPNWHSRKKFYLFGIIPLVSIEE